MSRISAYPKIFAIGQDYIRDIFKGEVEISEKVDGSQFSFGKVGGEIWVRSKGAQLYFENPEKMFLEAITYVDEIREKLPDDTIFYCEYLKKPKHNTLAYTNIPKNHLALFSVMRVDRTFDQDLEKWSEFLGIDRVPIFFKGVVKEVAEIHDYLERESYLGGQKIEGIVVKNYSQPFLLGGQPIPLMAGKYVSERFKEVHNKRWNKEESGKSRLQLFFDGFRTEARWKKAVQHLRDKSELDNSPKDIGSLIKEVHIDIEEEEIENIKNELYKEFKSQIMRTATFGLPEWYKNRLLESSFD